MKKRFQRADHRFFLREADAGMPVKDLSGGTGSGGQLLPLARQVRRHGRLDARRLKALEAEHQAQEAAGRAMLNRGDPRGPAKKW